MTGERNGHDDEPERFVLAPGELEQLVKRLRIRHMEEIEQRTGVTFDQLSTLRQGLYTHAIAFAVLAARRPDATWDEAGDVELGQLTLPADAAAEPDPTPPLDGSIVDVEIVNVTSGSPP